MRALAVDFDEQPFLAAGGNLFIVLVEEGETHARGNVFELGQPEHHADCIADEEGLFVGNFSLDESWNKPCFLNFVDGEPHFFQKLEAANFHPLDVGDVADMLARINFVGVNGFGEFDGFHG